MLDLAEKVRHIFLWRVRFIFKKRIIIHQTISLCLLHVSLNEHFKCEWCACFFWRAQAHQSIDIVCQGVPTPPIVSLFLSTWVLPCCSLNALTLQTVSALLLCLEVGASPKHQCAVAFSTCNCSTLGLDLKRESSFFCQPHHL